MAKSMESVIGGQNSLVKEKMNLWVDLEKSFTLDGRAPQKNHKGMYWLTGDNHERQQEKN